MRGVLLAVLVLAALAGASPAPAAAEAGDEEPFIVVYEDSVREPGAATSRRERAQGFRARQRFEEAVKGFAAPLSRRQPPACVATRPSRPWCPTARCVRRR